jgi:Family of unknown function (DUF6866) N-terminal domain/Family of unknown function (DUF6866) C-terminal domain
MPDPQSITPQVIHNCNISDAQHAGIFSICGLALRLRDLFKWNRGLAPWREGDSAEVLDWIDKREQKWEQLEEHTYADISINGRLYDPFDTAGINADLIPNGLFYGAGYAYGLKPTFFLCHIKAHYDIDGVTVYHLGRELARDLLTLPALSQDKSVVLREEAAMLFLWDQMQYINKSGRSLLQFALDGFGADAGRPETIKAKLPEIFDVYKGVYIHHEIGELRGTGFDAEVWRQIIADFPHTPLELLVRAVKDLLADTGNHGTLTHIVKSRQPEALGLYAAFLDGLRRVLFPELRTAFADFTQDRDWTRIETAISTGHQNARDAAADIMEIYGNGKKKRSKKSIRQAIEERFLGDTNPSGSD